MKTWTDDAKAHVDRYLRQVKVRLEGGGADAHEVVEDLGRHIVEQANDSPSVVITDEEIARILATVGSPDEVASAWSHLGDAKPIDDTWSAPRDPATAKPKWILKPGTIGWAICLVIGIVLGKFLLDVMHGMQSANTVVPGQETPANAGAPAADLPLPSGWFQAGTNIDDYTFTAVSDRKGFSGSLLRLQSSGNAPHGFSTAMSEKTAGPFRGKHVTMSARLETNLDSGGKAQLWLRIDGPGGEPLGFDNMGDRPVKGASDPKDYEIKLDVPQNAEKIAYGALMTGKGAIWFSMPELSTGNSAKATSNQGEMSIHDAAKGAHQQHIEDMLKNGADVNARDAEGRTALHYAAINGHPQLSQFLIAHGADKSIRDKHGKTAGDYAAFGGHEETLAAIRPTPGEIGPALSWFQAGNDHVNYQTGTANVDGIPGTAMFVQSVASNPAGFSTAMAETPAAPFRGKKITVTGLIKADIRAGWAGMWVRIDGPKGEPLGFDNMNDRPITGKVPAKTYTISMEVPSNAEKIALGILLQGEGVIYSNSLQLAAQ